MYRNRRRAITLVEIMVGAMIMVIFISAIYKVFRASWKTTQTGMWVNATQNAMRNALMFMREEIGRSTPFITITTGAPQVTDPCKLQFKSGVIDAGYNGDLIRFWQCRSAIDFGTTDAGNKTRVVIYKQGRRLMMKKENQGPGPSDENLFADRVLADDIVEVQITSVDASAEDQQLAKSMIQISLTAADPNRAERRVLEETKARAGVEAETF